MRTLFALATLIATLIASSFLVYALTVVAPGDPALAIFRARHGADAEPAPAILAEIRRDVGLDRPLHEQYATWLAKMVGGDFGTSVTRKVPVLPLLVQGIPPTLALVGGALLLAVVLAIPVGVAASRRGWLGYVTLAVTQLGVSVPDYFIAIVLVLVFSVHLGLLPASGWGVAAAVLLPIATLMLRPWAIMTRLVMTGVEEAMHSDWVRTGYAKGFSSRYILYRHVLPHAVLPVISVLGIAVGGALATALVVEVIFAVPGVGRRLYEAVIERDIPTVQAALLLQVALAVTANSIADAALYWVNPTLPRR